MRSAMPGSATNGHTESVEAVVLAILADNRYVIEMTEATRRDGVMGDVARAHDVNEEARIDAHGDDALPVRVPALSRIGEYGHALALALQAIHGRKGFGIEFPPVVDHAELIDDEGVEIVRRSPRGRIRSGSQVHTNAAPGEPRGARRRFEARRAEEWYAESPLAYGRPRHVGGAASNGPDGLQRRCAQFGEAAIAERFDGRDAFEEALEECSRHPSGVAQGGAGSSDRLWGSARPAAIADNSRGRSPPADRRAVRAPHLFAREVLQQRGTPRV